MRYELRVGDSVKMSEMLLGEVVMTERQGTAAACGT
jgi:hypothetical protein